MFQSIVHHQVSVTELRMQCVVQIAFM